MFGNFSSFMTPSPGWVSVLNSFASLFVFYILSYLLLKRMGCLSGCLVSSASVQKLLLMSVNKFCSFLAFGVGLSGMLSAFSDSARETFDEFIDSLVLEILHCSSVL